MNLSIIILAAGQSSRLGQPKQLLPFRNTTLIQHIIQQTLSVKTNQTIVVLGAYAPQIRPALASANVEIVINEDWKKGMQSSLKKGLERVPGSDAVLVLLSDQPFVNPDLLNQIITIAKACKHPIVATKYSHTLGVPALFKSEVFEELMTLITEGGGAKKIIKKYAAKKRVGIIDFPEGAMDIDTMEDYEQLK